MQRDAHCTHEALKQDASGTYDAPMSVAVTLKRFEFRRTSAILRTPHRGAVLPALEAAVEGGFRIIECTLNTPGALQAIQVLSKDKELLVGAGTVLSVADAELAAAAGARFLVSPVADADVITWCVDNDICVIPGTFSPKEMLEAHRLGAPIVKLFPGPPDGPSYVRTVLGPLPFLRIFPTSGVTLENAAQYLAHGAFGVGFVNCLFQPEDLEAGRFKAIRERAAKMVAAVS